MEILLASLMLIGNVGQTPCAARTDSIVIQAEYHVEFTDLPLVPKFVSGFFGNAAQFLGIAPRGMDYRETIIGPGCQGDDFRLALKEHSGREWLRVSSDTTSPSFIDPPKLKTGLLKKGQVEPVVIQFIAGVRNFFLHSVDSSFNATFVLWNDTLDFHLARDAVRPSTYWFICRKKEEPYLKGDVVVERSDGLVTYSRMSIYSYKEGVGMILELKKLDIVNVDHGRFTRSPVLENNSSSQRQALGVDSSWVGSNAKLSP